MLCRRTFLLAAAVAVAASRASADTPATGKTDAKFAAFDKMMADYLPDKRVPGAALAVTYNGKLVYSRGFGYADADQKVKVEPDALFRIASVSKPITAVGVLQLVEKGKIKLDDPIQNYVTLEPSPAPGEKADARLKDVTVRHCLQHTAGWVSKPSDPISIPDQIARALKIDLPLPPEGVVRYVLGKPLEFDPGSKYAYSNSGYLMLGRAIEAASGQKYEEYIRKEVFRPLGITRAVLGHALPEKRAEGEVSYFDLKKRTGPCMFPPGAGKQVPIQDGHYNIDGFEAHGGWVMSAPDLTRFAAAFDDPAKCKLLGEKTIATMWERPKVTPQGPYYGCGWLVSPVGDGVMAWHNGLIPGDCSVMLRRPNGVTYAVLLNSAFGPDDKMLLDTIEPMLNKVSGEMAWR